MKKYLVLVFCLLSMSFTYASLSDLYDCRMSYDYDGILKSVFEKKTKYWILERQDVEVALQHLNAYCCAKKYLTDNCGVADNEVPESPYLWDHLIDAVMRKLDAMDAPLWFKPDPEAKARRDQIRKIAKQTKWETPKKIVEDFTSKWKVWEEWWMAEKYKQWCLWVSDLLDNFVKTQTERAQTNENIESIKANCDIIATSRVNKEMAYVQTVMMSKWIQLLHDNLNAYLKDYFLKEKMDTLIEKFKKFSWLFGRVSQRLNEWTATCWW